LDDGVAAAGTDLRDSDIYKNWWLFLHLEMWFNRSVDWYIREATVL
jgi:hypothetical protein